MPLAEHRSPGNGFKQRYFFFPRRKDVLQRVATSFLNASSFPPLPLILPLSSLSSVQLVLRHTGVGGLMGLEEDSGSFFTSLVQVSVATLTFLMARPQAHAGLIGPDQPSAAERSKHVSHWGIFKAAFHFLMGKRPSAPIGASSSHLESPEPSATQGPKLCHCPSDVLAGLGTSAGTESHVSCVKALWDRPVPSSKGRSNVLGLDLGLWVEGPCLGTAPVPRCRNSPFAHETVTEPTRPFGDDDIKANCGHPGDVFRSCDAEMRGSRWE